jgi:hypothetical protein
MIEKFDGVGHRLLMVRKCTGHDRRIDERRADDEHRHHIFQLIPHLGIGRRVGLQASFSRLNSFRFIRGVFEFRLKCFDNSIVSLLRVLSLFPIRSSRMASYVS